MNSRFTRNLVRTITTVTAIAAALAGCAQDITTRTSLDEARGGDTDHSVVSTDLTVDDVRVDLVVQYSARLGQSETLSVVGDLAPDVIDYIWEEESLRGEPRPSHLNVYVNDTPAPRAAADFDRRAQSERDICIPCIEYPGGRDGPTYWVECWITRESTTRTVSGEAQ